ncbi:actin-like ATPase domain-containing protein [Aspergillus phoenicis ATCC 13157]|uniref:Actin-like ATPase domain-containing protein n=1 Tax=Aspergillus phoenicis ATCC 13157 TaxID=1353007 RepID=A0A370PJX3_ASPPH|nr:actin-like ATPase domain-containing protein [Aspergillus phoenicis ATCC 13157]
MSDKEALGPPTKSTLQDGEWKPNIVVGVDFGMTHTGVAYSYGPDWPPPKTIQRWPGKLPGELANKVPTCIIYGSDSKTVSHWGFQCDIDNYEAQTKEFFKLHLAPQYVRDGGPSLTEAQKWFQDYIQCIYRHVVSYFETTIPQFVTQRVEFIFSVPTTWKDVRMVEEIRRLLMRVIDARNPNHRARIGLTEAEAAAVYAGNEHYGQDDTILVCDSGGGTTDVNVLKLLSAQGEPTQLAQLGHVEGHPIGSVFIDREIHRIMCKRLEGIHQHLKSSPNTTAWRMTFGRFQRYKCAFGTDATATPWLKLDVPGLDPNLDFPEAGIFNGQMQIAWEDVQKSFDSKVDGIFQLIDTHIQQLRAQGSSDDIKYLVLSGGLGSSPYVRQRLQERYNCSSKVSPTGVTMQVLMADEPQLVVVHGLVMDRTQQLKRGVLTFGFRCAPVSYGIICHKVYNREIHVGERVQMDVRDKRLYALDQIDWLVVKGRPIPPTGVTKEFHLRTDVGLEAGIHNVEIVMSTELPDRLPRSLSHEGWQTVCNLDIATDNVDRKLKNRHWYSSKPAFWRTSFEVRVVVGPADLSFQLWSRGERIRSKHEPISVHWMPAEKT